MMDRWRKSSSGVVPAHGVDAPGTAVGEAGTAGSKERCTSERPRVSSDVGSARSSERYVPEEDPDHLRSGNPGCGDDMGGEDSSTTTAIAAAAAAAAAVGVYGMPGRHASKEHGSMQAAISAEKLSGGGGGGGSLTTSSFGRLGRQHDSDPLLPPKLESSVTEDGAGSSADSDPPQPARQRIRTIEEDHDDAEPFLVQDEDSDREFSSDAPLVIQADASLLDGLRALLVHHLKRSVGANIVSLSASQAELLEHHLARLASYATKIVHTLAFATRFLSKHNCDQDNQGTSQFSGASQGGLGQGSSGATNSTDMARYAAGAKASTPAAAEPRPPRKALKLNDDEILSLYRSAQMEASIEADWRGISGPPRMGSDGDGRSSSHRGSKGGTPTKDSDTDAKSGDLEYLRMLSRAMQQPGRSPRTFTAEILDPTKDSSVVCCAPHFEPVFKAAASATALQPPAGGPPDPGSHRTDRARTSGGSTRRM